MKFNRPFYITARDMYGDGRWASNLMSGRIPKTWDTTSFISIYRFLAQIGTGYSINNQISLSTRKEFLNQIRITIR